MSAEVVFSASDFDEGERADIFICSGLDGVSRSAVQKLLTSGAVTINGERIKKSVKISSGDEVRVLLPDPVLPSALPENIPLDIVYEDADVIVVNKPRGMVVHPAPGSSDGTLVNALLYHCGDSLSGINGVLRPGIVHRIDKDTSGLLLVAKNDKAHVSLAEQIKEHSCRREYLAVVRGAPKEDKGVIDAPIGRSLKDRKKQAVFGSSPRDAVTHYEVLENYPSYSLVKCVLETGRTHQIRVHMAYIGHPVAGDTVYGGAGNDRPSGGQCLHAATIGFVHPASGIEMNFTAPLPDYFKEFLNTITSRS